mgnify:CR=1 FL=1
MNKQQCITILGSTGSIGTSTLDVLSRHPAQYRIHALTASSQVDLMLAQCGRFKPEVAVMVQESAGRQLAERVKAEGLPVQVRWGAAALDEVASAPQVDAVMAAIVGAAGLSPCIAAARAGKRLMLANKEALVVGGDVFLRAVREGGALLLPIDSEHSAIFQSLPEDASSWQRRVQKIILTASGGPFRTRDPRTLREVTPEQACAHPNWVMGRKISVDSATMMNKALEVIEARYLFGLSPDQLEVVIHPQSVIHSMVQYRDHSVVAQLGTPDMRVPIAYGLSFEAMDEPEHVLRFPGLRLAWETLRGAPGSCAILNAANEVAVEAFLNKRIRFDQIHELNRATLDSLQCSPPECLDDLLALDARSRQEAERNLTRLA